MCRGFIRNTNKPTPKLGQSYQYQKSAQVDGAAESQQDDLPSVSLLLNTFETSQNLPDLRMPAALVDKANSLFKKRGPSGTLDLCCKSGNRQNPTVPEESLAKKPRINIGREPVTEGSNYQYVAKRKGSENDIKMVDSFSDYSSLPSSVNGSPPVVMSSPEPEPWERFLDDLDNDLYQPSSRKSSLSTLDTILEDAPVEQPKQEKKSEGSLLAQLLQTDMPVRDAYEKLNGKTSSEKSPRSSSPTPSKESEDSGFGQSLSPFPSFGSPVSSFPQEETPFLSPPPVQSYIPPPPYSASTLFDSCEPEADLIQSPLTDIQEGGIKEKRNIFEPTAPQWEFQTFSRPSIFPQTDVLSSYNFSDWGNSLDASFFSDDFSNILL